LKPVLVIKFGTASISDSGGQIDESTIAAIARQVATIHAKYHIVLVSSGAVGAGKSKINGFKGELSQRKAAAAIGNPILMAMYATHFQHYGITVAQSLCERGHFANRAQFLQLHQTYQTLWKSGIIPIANENDVVSDFELKFSDNDELATLLAAGLGAKVLLFSTSVGGLLDASGSVIPRVETIDDTVWKWVDTRKSASGLGGMVSKLSYAKRANELGIKAIIFGIQNGPNAIGDALGEKCGTVLMAQEVNPGARKRWLSTGSLVAGSLWVDHGAAQAIQNRKSLLAVGVAKVEGQFNAGETIDIYNSDHQLIATAVSRLSALEVRVRLGKANTEIAHADHIVVYHPALN